MDQVVVKRIRATYFIGTLAAWGGETGGARRDWVALLGRLRRSNLSLLLSMNPFVLFDRPLGGSDGVLPFLVHLIAAGRKRGLHVERQR